LWLVYRKYTYYTKVTNIITPVLLGRNKSKKKKTNFEPAYVFRMCIPARTLTFDSRQTQLYVLLALDTTFSNKRQTRSFRFIWTIFSFYRRNLNWSRSIDSLRFRNRSYYIQCVTYFCLSTCRDLLCIVVDKTTRLHVPFRYRYSS